MKGLNVRAETVFENLFLFDFMSETNCVRIVPVVERDSSKAALLQMVGKLDEPLVVVLGKPYHFLE